ncbi:FtsQ-type POTRA domain-containing protein, partial [Candidatus Gracilibacteria bacterium]|nr:FtsQ-type POTRA domain-containing protein [Candidatus Gracilibacteria bacterium]
MDFVKNIKNFYNKFKKYFENRKFRERIKKEKSQKYLFVVPEKKRKIFCFIKNKKFFSNFTVTVGDNVKNYRYYYLAIGLVLFSLSFYIIFISPYFRISPSKVIIERLDTITDINIAYKSVENFYGQSIFLIDKNDIKKTISGLQKNIKKVEVSRLFPSGLKIIIESYSPQFITNFKGIDKNYIITSNGVLIYEKNLDKTLYNLEIVDINLLESGFFDYKEGIDEDSIKKIIFARDLFKDMFSNKN